MIETFTTIMTKVTLPSEGGLVDDPHDPGGLTNRGLTMADMRRHSVTATPDDLRALTVAEAMDIYLVLYWYPVRGGQLPAPISCMVFDHGVNAGIGDSARLLQKAANVTVDGWIGPETLYAVNNRNALTLLASLRTAQEADYRNKADAQFFIKGWDARLDLRTRIAMTL